MPWTPLHAALGETDAALELALFERACEAGITESTNLDWKRALPLTTEIERGKQGQELELAKDIAAMANSGGGMIVYGIVEAGRGSSAADRVELVGPIDEHTLRAIRRVAGTLIYPPVTGLDLTAIRPEPEADAGILVMVVPDSVETPHLIHPSAGKRDWFSAPYRHGPDTNWMVERQISAAYVARETRRRQADRDFDDRYSAFVASLPGGDSNWVVALAVPDVLLPRPRELKQATAHRIIERAWTYTSLIQDFGPRDLTVGSSTRRGLQSFVRQGSKTLSGGGGAVARARIELHGDGSVAVAFTQDGAIPREQRQRSQVPLDNFRAVAHNLFALLWESRAALRVASDYTARITVTPPTQIFRIPDPVVRDAYQPWNESHRIYNYAPVTGPIIASEGREGALRSWFELADDAINQTGYNWPLDPDRVLLALELQD